MFTRYVNSAYLKLSYPMSTFLYDPADRFNDLLKTFRDVKAFNTHRGGVTMAYTPLHHFVLYVGLRLAELLNIGSHAVLWITLAAFLAILVYFLVRCFTDRRGGTALNAQRVFTLAVLSFPVLFLMDRANTEMFVFAAILGFVFFYYIRPHRWLWIVFLAIAIGLKIYPAVLILIPLSDRRFRDTTFVVLATVAATIAAVFAIGIQSQYGFSGVWDYWIDYLIGGQGSTLSIWWPGINHGHSLWGASYLTNVLIAKPFGLAILRQGYLVFVLLVALAGSAWVLFGRLLPWHKLTIAVFMFLLLPFSSHDYTLVHAFFPLALFVATREVGRFDRTLTVLFALLLVPLDYYYFVQSPGWWPFELAQYLGVQVSISVLVYPAIMLAILALVGLQARQLRKG